MSAVLATGALNGPEARGSVSIVDSEAERTIEIADLWVAPGAPDVRIYASPHADGTIDDSSTELTLFPYPDGPHVWSFPGTLDAERARSIVIYCGVYSVYFGHAELEWL